MKEFIKKNLLLFTGISLTLGLAPFNSPHIVGKMKWILGGNAFHPTYGLQLQDWFDVFLHGLPWVLLILSSILNLSSKLKTENK
ncbi:MAG: hypothetical protein HC798_02900 [Polaribacter sp.]|nr:hypothetical protein [Polaribacter sp.]